MAGIYDLDQKITKFARNVQEKARGTTESMKISSAIKDEESKQRDLFQQIGAYYYRQYANQAEGQLRTLCDSVAASQQTVAQYQEQLRLIKGIVHCPNCNAEMPLNSAFCSSCGARIAPPTFAGNAQSGLVCQRCGQPLKEGHLFCTNCGLPIPQAPKDQPEEVFEPEQAKKEDILVEGLEAEEPENDIGDPLVSEEKRICRNCGNELLPEQIFCTECGMKFE